MNTKEKLIKADCTPDEAELITKVIEESEDEIRACTGLCSDSNRINTCMN